MMNCRGFIDTRFVESQSTPKRQSELAENMVGAAGLEPTAPRSQSGCATTAPRPDEASIVTGTTQN
jgi:hypothetical protein